MAARANGQARWRVPMPAAGGAGSARLAASGSSVRPQLVLSTGATGGVEIAVAEGAPLAQQSNLLEIGLPQPHRARVLSKWQLAAG